LVYTKIDTFIQLFPFHMEANRDNLKRALACLLFLELGYGLSGCFIHFQSTDHTLRIGYICHSIIGWVYLLQPLLERSQSLLGIFSIQAIPYVLGSSGQIIQPLADCTYKKS